MSIKGTWVFRSKMAAYGSSFNVNVDVTFHTYSGESVSSWDGTYMNDANSAGIIAFRNGSKHQGVVFRYSDIYSYEDSWSSLKIYSYSEAPALLTTVTFNTDTFDVISGSITAESFLTWLQANATKIEDTPTITRVLKKLFLGDVVAKGTTRQLRKLTTEKPQEDSIVGTWVIKENIPEDDYQYLKSWQVDYTTSYIDSNGEIQTETYNQKYISITRSSTTQLYGLSIASKTFYTDEEGNIYPNGNYIRCRDELGQYHNIDKTSTEGIALRTVTILSDNINYGTGALFSSYFKTVAEKVS